MPEHARRAGGAESDLASTAVDLRYAQSLLQQLAIESRQPLSGSGEHPALLWARSGLMALSGARDAPPQMCPVPLAACADGALGALASLASEPEALANLRGATLLAERAALTGLSRNGALSAGTHCRLVAAADATLAVNLARADDWSLLPAWLEADVTDWPSLISAIRERSADALLERARWLGLAVAKSELPVTPRPWFERIASGTRHLRDERHRPRVVDLSSLWAGPLCGRLLQQLGAEVIKVESLARPDGTRAGSPAFFDAMHAGKASVALDFTASSGRAQLAALLDRADIVIEASRPRALRQLGIDAEARVRDGRGLTWVSITGYGRRAPQDQWIAYGDDAGVAAGLSELMRIASGEPLFCADAIADPLTGLHAALAAWATYRQGGGALLSLSLCDVAAHVAAFERPAQISELRSRAVDWQQLALAEVAPPVAPAPQAKARPFGADTETVLRAWNIAC